MIPSKESLGAEQKTTSEEQTLKELEGNKVERKPLSET